MKDSLAMRKMVPLVFLCALLVSVVAVGAAFGVSSNWLTKSNQYANISGRSTITAAQKNAFATTEVRANSYTPDGYAGAQGVAYKNGARDYVGPWVYNKAMSAGASFTSLAPTSTAVGTSATVSSYGNMKLYIGGSGQYAVYSLYQSPNLTI